MPNYLEAVHAYAAAISSLNPDAYAACFAANGEVHDPVGAPPHVGHEGARAFMNQFVPLLASINFRPGKILVSGGHAAFTWEIEATGKNGQTASAEGIDTLAFDGEGKITRIYGFWNPGPFVAALTA